MKEQIKQITENSPNIVIISHMGPDGDTLGSMLALRKMLEQVKSIKKIDMIIIGRIPDVYKFLPGISDAKNANNEELYTSYDLAITVDCASFDRLGDAVGLFRNAKTTLNIDHHISNTKFGDTNWIKPKASATGELLYEMLDILKIELTQEIATCLYVAILTYTGGFRFDNTKPHTHVVAAKLLQSGINPTRIYKECYESKPLAMIKLQARAIDQANFQLPPIPPDSGR